MKTTSIVAVLCLVIGFASGWLIKPAPEASSSAETTNSPDNPTRPSSRSTTSNNSSDSQKSRSPRRSGVTVSRVGSNEDMDPETKKAIEEAQKKQAEMMRKRFSDKFNLQITAMIKELGLNTEQEKSLRAFFDARLDKIELSNMSDVMTDPDKIKEIATALRGEGMNEHMQSVLSEDQMKKLEALQERKKNSKIEARAMKDLAKLQQTLDLNEDQKQKVYDLMIEDAEKGLAAQSDADLVTRSMMSAMGVEMDLGDMDMGTVMSLHTEGGDTPTDRAGIIQKLKDDRKKKIDDKVARFAPILDETQQEQYRKSLENKGGMFNMMIQGVEGAEEEE